MKKFLILIFLSFFAAYAFGGSTNVYLKKEKREPSGFSTSNRAPEFLPDIFVNFDESKSTLEISSTSDIEGDLIIEDSYGNTVFYSVKVIGDFVLDNIMPGDYYLTFTTETWVAYGTLSY